MFGRDLLIVPKLTELTPVKFVFPKGIWYDFFTHQNV